MTALSGRVESWRRRGASEEVLGRRLFVRRRDGDDGPPVAELPEAAHYPQIEQPEPIAAALDDALARAQAG